MKAVVRPVEPAERDMRLQHIRPLYLESLTLVERLHRRLLDVIKDEFDRRGRADINSVQALLDLQYRRQGADRGRTAHARLLSRLQRVLQSQEAGRDGLPRPSALAGRPPLGAHQADRQGPRGARHRRGALPEARAHGRAGRRHQCRRVRDAQQGRCSGSSGSGPTRSSTGSNLATDQRHGPYHHAPPRRSGPRSSPPGRWCLCGPLPS